MAESGRKYDPIQLYVLLERIGEANRIIQAMKAPGQCSDLCMSPELFTKEHILKQFQELLQKANEEEYKRNDLLEGLRNRTITRTEREFDYTPPNTDEGLVNNPDVILYGDTLLHFALTLPLSEDSDMYGYIETRDTIIELLLESYPDMLVSRNDFEITPMQIAIAKQERKIVKAMLKRFRARPDMEGRFTFTAGEKFDGTNMMAATPVGIAAVTFNKNIFRMCVEAGVPIDLTNNYGDNVIHSLIRHSYRQTDPRAQKNVLKWFKYIDSGIWSKKSEKRKSTFEMADTERLMPRIEVRKLTTETSRSIDSLTDCRQTQTIPAGALSPRILAATFTTESQATNAEIMLKQKWRVGGLWTTINKEGISPLLLAAKLGQFDLFKYIMDSAQFTMKKFDDGSVSNEEYNITNIDTLSAVGKSSDDKANTKDARTDRNSQESHSGKGAVQVQKDRHISIFEFILMEEPSVAFKFVSFPPVRGVIQAKWAWYKWIVRFWFLIHTVFMCLYSWYSVERSRQYVTPYEEETVSMRGDPDFVINIQNHPLMAIGIAGGVLATFYLTCLIASYCSTRFRVKPNKSGFKNVRDHIQKPYSNTVFKLLFIVFSVCLLFDFLFATSIPQKYEHFLTPFCLIIGFYLIVFFLRTLKPFTMFSLLMQRLIFDLFEFAVIMVVMLVGFSFAMFVVMQGAATDDNSFQSVDRTLVKMLMIMLGIGDLGVLFQARYSQLAIFVFVLFVLLTTILLLNALIATMSMTCTALMPQYGDVTTKQLHYRMQKLSMSIFLESFLPSCMLKSVGELKSVGKSEKNTIRILSRSSIKEPEKSGDKPEIVLAYIAKQSSPKRSKRYPKVKPTCELNRRGLGRIYGTSSDLQISEVPDRMDTQTQTQQIPAPQDENQNNGS